MIIPFPGHQWAQCTDPYCSGCHLCHGGLAVCKRCGGMEGGLTTDCPGERMTGDQHDDVYEGRTDFLRFRGWVAQASIHSPAGYKS